MKNATKKISILLIALLLLVLLLLGPTAPAQDGEEEATPKAFVPTEKVRADSSVSFPVDI